MRAYRWLGAQFSRVLSVVSRFWRIWRQLGSLPFALFVTRHHASVPVLRALALGARIELHGETSISYGGCSFPLRLDVCLVLDRIIELLNAGWSIKPAGSGHWRAAKSPGMAFIVNDEGLRAELHVLHARFVGGEYSDLEVDGRVVIDIGANIGDTPVYFATRGAAHVVAFEPFLITADRCRANVALSGWSDRVTVVDVGIGKRAETREVVYVPSQSPMLSVLDDPPERRTGRGSSMTSVEILPLAEALQLYAPASDRPLVGKIDCEGCEFEIFCDASSPTLEGFDQLAVEYHWRDPAGLVKILSEAGFNVRIVTGEPGFGVLYAKRPLSNTVVRPAG